MALRSVTVALVLMLSASGSARAQEFSTFSSRGKGTSSTRFTAGEYTCTVSVLGDGTCTLPSGRAWKFRLPAEPRGTDIEVLYVVPYGDGMLLLAEFDDSDSGWGRMVRLQRGASRPVWSHQLQAFNLVAPVRIGDDVFVAGLAFAARLDARTGRFVWSHIGRYEVGDMDAPEHLEISPNRIIVRGRAGGKQKVDCFARTTGAVTACP